MPLKVIVGSTTKDAARADFYPSTTAKRVKRIEAWNGSAWKLVQLFLAELSVSASPASVEGYGPGGPLAPIISGSSTVTPSGGAAPFTYAWATLTGGPFTITSPNTETSAFGANLNDGEIRTGVVRCTVTDRFGTSATADVSVFLQNGIPL